MNIEMTTKSLNSTNLTAFGQNAVVDTAALSKVRPIISINSYLKGNLPFADYPEEPCVCSVLFIIGAKRVCKPVFLFYVE